MSNDADRPTATGPFDPPLDGTAEPGDATGDGGRTGFGGESGGPLTGSTRRKGGKARDERRVPGPITADYLFRAAAHYIERYATSSGNLARVLERKVMRRARARGEMAQGHDEAIAATVKRFVDLKLVDDEVFAETKLASLRRRGTSSRMAAAKLAGKGVERDLIAVTLAADESDDRTAANAYARRRRLGPYRLREREERRDKDVAAMVRAGFSYGDAAAIVDGERIAAPGFILPEGNDL